jgi:FdhE protein
VGAALQAALAARAAGLGAVAQAPPEREGSCPACGGPPVAGVVGAEDRLRWLSCARCATEWNVPRVRCTACETSASPEYLHLDEDPGAKAEACPDCRTYVKLFDLARRPGAEPGADDAATIALDLLVAEQGFHRAAANPLVGAGAAR